MKNRVLAKMAVLALCVFLLAGCGSSGSGSSGEDDKTITVAATPTPHAEILDHVKDELAEEGYDLQVTEYEDYIQPNEVVESGEFDANYFQHVNYLEDYNKENESRLVSAGKIHYEPFGIYPGTKDSLDDIAGGDVIAIPNDPTNEARALMLLEEAGIIRLKEGAGIQATINDIEEYIYDIEPEELEAAQVSRVKDEVAYMVLNGNYALSADLSAADDALLCESQDSESIQQYVNVIAVEEGHENDAKIQALVDVLKSDDVQDWIREEYEGAVIPYTSE